MGKKTPVSLTFKVFSIAGMSLMSFMFALSYLSYLQNFESGMKELDKECELVHDRLAQTLLLPIWNFDDPQTDAIIRLELRNENVTGIRINDKLRKLRVGYVRETEDKIAPIHDEMERILNRTAYRVTSIKLENANVELGTVDVYFTDIPVRARLERGFVDLIARTGLVTVIALALVFLYFRIAILTPIFDLTKTVESFGEGNMALRTNVRRNDELGALASGFNEMADRIESNAINLENVVNDRTSQLVEAEKFAFLGSLVAGVAHEINTPIGIGITAVSHQLSESNKVAELLASGNLKKSDLDKFIQDSLETARIIDANLVRAGAFIQSFKMIAVDQSTEERRTFKVKQYLEEIVFTMRPKLKKTLHQVVIDCDENLEVSGYPGGISQILTNLIVNSLVHGLYPDIQGTIRLQASVEPPAKNETASRILQIVYSDDGKGITADNLKRIFTPFFTTLRGSGGTGLGLYIIQRTTVSMGGTIVCESESGNGVRFTIRLPVNES